MTNDVHVNDVRHHLNDNNILIDVREQNELLETGYVPGAIHVPMSTLDIEDDVLKDNKDKTLYVMCRSGKRSLDVQAFLNQHGYQSINVSGGIIEYEGEVEHL